MNTLPIIQTFFDKPVRFFKAEIAVSWGGYDNPPSIMQTWGIPFPDFCEAIGHDEKNLKRKIKLDDAVYKELYWTETIWDRTNSQRRRTALMAYEMCQMIIAKLETSRIKDPAIREMITRFQRWVIFAFHLIRTGKLRGVRWNMGKDIPSEFLRILSLPSGSETHKAVLEQAQKEGKCEQRVYKKLQQVRGSNSITSKGIPKKSPSTKGAYRNTLEFKTVEFIYCQLPTLQKKEIARISGVTYAKGVRWLRAA